MGLFAFAPLGEEKRRIGKMESKNFKPFVGRLMGRAVPQKKKAIQLNGLDQLLAERVSAGMVSAGVRIHPKIVDI